MTTTVPPLNLRKTLDYLLRDRRITASELSRRTGVSKQVLSDWMAGVMPKRLDHLKKVALTLEVSLDELLFGSSMEPDHAGLSTPTSVSFEEGVFHVTVKKIK